MLLDHFHPPLTSHRHWTSFHNAWACRIAEELNAVLPDRWFAEPHVRFEVEIDDAVFDNQLSTGDLPKEWSATIPELEWSVPEPTVTVEFSRSGESVGVRVFSTDTGPLLVGALELVSPANKHQAAAVNSFVAKCEAYLDDGIGLVIVDVVTLTSLNLHLELLERLQIDFDSGVPRDSLFASSYRPTGPTELPHLQIWEYELGLGRTLPTIPFPLKNGPCLRLDLASAYQHVCSALKLTAVA